MTRDGLPTTCDCLPTTCDGLPTTCDGLPTTSDGLRTTRDGLRTTRDALNSVCAGVYASPNQRRVSDWQSGLGSGESLAVSAVRAASADVEEDGGDDEEK